jgi:CDP-glucose 4,6-dehydratase
MENLVTMFRSAYKNRCVLITGHTGFKGSWLALWLQTLGARVVGISLPPETIPNHWNLLGLDTDSHYLDIRDNDLVRAKVEEINPEIVFHMAAQPLVRHSYQQPLDTWSTNVMGTANVLDACRRTDRLAGIIVVTTDKCYENKDWVWGYREIDPLGGHDPYSASKAGAELVTASYRSSFFSTGAGPHLATARAGNVIGGGDWSKDRLIPDLVRAVTAGKPLEIRSPHATRPWQHVLDCLSGYLRLGQKLLEDPGAAAQAWNFGPDKEGNREVQEVLAAFRAGWPAVEWKVSDAQQPHEAKLLQLDSAKARDGLSWMPVWNFAEAVEATSAWYRAWFEQNALTSRDQLDAYVTHATQLGLSWTKTI